MPFSTNAYSCAEIDRPRRIALIKYIEELKSVRLNDEGNSAIRKKKLPFKYSTENRVHLKDLCISKINYVEVVSVTLTEDSSVNCKR